MSRRTRNIIVAIMLVVVVVPLVPLVLWSFAETWPAGQILPTFGTGAWQRALADKQVMRALGHSFLLSGVVVALSLILGFFAAKNLGTKTFKGRRAIQLLLLVPSFVPQISIVFGMQKVFARIGLTNSFWGLVVALLVFYVPYMTLLLSAVFENYDLDYERQARCLGVKPLDILFRVTLPAVRSGVVVSCLFSFIGSWGAYLIISAVAPPSFKTLSLVLFPMINSGTNGFPITAAIVLLYILPILAVLVVFSKLLVNDTNKTNTGGLL